MKVNFWQALGVVLIVVGAIGFILFKPNKTSTNDTTNKQTTTQAATTQGAGDAGPATPPAQP